MTDLPPEISDVGATGAGVLAALHEACFDDAWSTEAVAGLLGMPGIRALVIAAARRPAGFVMLSLAADEAEIVTLCIAPERRRCGFGRRLLAAALDRAAAAGAVRMTLEVAVDNVAAQVLYRAAGFTPVGRRPGYYAGSAGGTRDAAILALDLAPHST